MSSIGRPLIGRPLVPNLDHAEIIRRSESLAQHLTPPPRSGDDVCPLCHSWRADDLPVCSSCDRTAGGVGYPVGPISVVSLTTKPSPLRDWLTRYKGRDEDGDDRFEPESFDRIRDIVARYFIEHGQQLWEQTAPVDAIVVVPSAGDRPLPHPMARILDLLDLGVPVADLLRPGPGEVRTRHSASDGYVCTEPGRGRRVLLVDDVLVSGAHAYSAARALIDGGYTVAATLAVARRVNRDWGDCQSLWDRASAEPYAWAMSPLTTTSTLER